MAELRIDDGVVLHWDERGVQDGPLLVAATQFSSPPSVFEGLWADLARDHRLITYDMRGVGESTRVGPYDLEQDGRDLAQLIEGVGDGPATVIAFGDGANRGVRAAAERPDLVSRVVGPAGNPLGREAARDQTGLASSAGVLVLLQEQITRDYRAAIRTIVSSANPDWDDTTVRQRVELNVEYCPQEAAAARLSNWINDDALEISRSLGDRLWIVTHDNNPWFPRALAARTRELVPDARVIELDDGPITRPDLHAEVIREASGQA
jgi:pimeloyl-ACP methyl ester carboxylesterase